MASRTVTPTRSGGGGPIALGRPASQPVLTHCLNSLRQNIVPAALTHFSRQAATPLIHDLVVCVQLTEEDELMWDDGTANPEYCLDQFNLVGRVNPYNALSWFSHKAMLTLVLRLQWEAVGMMAAGLSVFGLVALAARLNDKASKIPYVSCYEAQCCLG